MGKWYDDSIFMDWYLETGQYLVHPECMEEAMAEAFLAGYEKKD